MSDEELRLKISKNSFNGSYATEICRRCGRFKSSPEGDASVAKIVDICTFCFEKEARGN